MNKWLDRLKRDERRGSKPRCHLLTHGSPDAVATRLAVLVSPFANVTPSDHWMPLGFDDISEATLPEAERLLPAEVRLELKRWWLAVPSRKAMTPNWDIASTCTIEGKPGMVLIEAKAHDKELINEEVGKRYTNSSATEGSRRNHEQIGTAIAAASAALAENTRLPWALSRDSHYQMGNRFAWAWKLTGLGIPVVLIYLGFLNAKEMIDLGRPFVEAEDWENVVKGHSKVLFPAEVWDRRWTCGGQSLIPLIRSLDVPLNNEGSV